MNESWFYETHKESQSFGLKVNKVLCKQQSDFQEIFIFENEDYGKVLVLDGAYMLSELDEHIYHKALTSYGMQNIHDTKNDLKVLVIGAGDGGTVRDLIQNWHQRINKITMVEIDSDVIEQCKIHFPNLTCKLDHEKVDLKVEDAIEFIKNSADQSFDLILCDSTDPEGFAEGLIEVDFYRGIKRILKEDGIFCAQSGSPFFQKEELAKTKANLSQVFDASHTYYAPVIVYPGTIWSFTAAGKTINKKENINIEDFIPEEKVPANATT